MDEFSRPQKPLSKQYVPSTPWSLPSLSSVNHLPLLPLPPAQIIASLQPTPHPPHPFSSLCPNSPRQDRTLARIHTTPGPSEAPAAQRPMTSYLPSAPCCPWASRQLGPSWIPSHHQPRPMFQNSLPNNDDNCTVISEGLVWSRLRTMEKRQVPTAPIP